MLAVKGKITSGMGTFGVIFIWASFLWSVLVTFAYLSFKKSIIKKGKYFLVSTIVEYAIYILSNILLMYLASNFINTEEIKNTGINLKLALNSFIFITMLILFLPPIASSHYVAKKYS